MASVLVGLCGGLAYAQVTTATVSGVVTDTSGGVLPGATVALTNETTAAALSAVSNERGEFTIAFVPVGRYSLTVALSGFADYMRKDMSLSAAQSVNLTIPLGMSGVTDTVTVSGATPLVNRANAQQQAVVSDQQLRELPIGSRDWSDTVGLDTSIVKGDAGQAVRSVRRIARRAAAALAPLLLRSLRGRGVRAGHGDTWHRPNA
ncbi:MAG: hypothetical protein GEU99_20415 [Luteitalea sp.]|nr:hypothetical protein [Luteitalea sp.]